MPSLRDIRKRIGSVKSSRQITRAMKMVSAAKLRRAQDAILKARPYAVLLERAIAEVAARADGGALSSPLLQARPPKKVELVLITSDRGLAGGFNANILRRAQRFVTENGDKYEAIEISTIGRKAREYFKARGGRIRHDYAGVHQTLRFEKAKEIADELTARYLAGEVDEVLLCYNQFKSAISQVVTIHPLLPIVTAPTAGASSAIDFVYEPQRDAMLQELLPRHLAMQVWRALLESAASEHGSRMTAMDSATKNAEDIIGKLTLDYNRARQAYITKELMEIVSGAESLK